MDQGEELSIGNMPSTGLTVSQNGGTTCPSCRGLSTSVIPSRALQSMVNVLLRADPSRIRTPSERAQADEVYRSGQSLRVRDRFPARHQQLNRWTHRFLHLGSPHQNQLYLVTRTTHYPVPTVSQGIHLGGSQCFTRLTVALLTESITAVQIPSLIQKLIKTRRGFWRTVRLLVTGSVGTGKSLCLGPVHPTHPITAKPLWLCELPPRLAVTFVKSPFVESEYQRGAAQLYSTLST
jgi:hypothetical protein